MRRSVLICTMVAAMLAFSAGAALAAVIQCQGGTCEGTPNPDTMTGTASRDIMHGKAGTDELRGRDGSDLLSGDSGSDRLLAGAAGNDFLKGGAGNDTLDGGAGNDSYWFEDGWGEGTISADSGETQDWILFWTVTASSVTVDLSSSNNVKAYSGVNKVKWSSTVAIENAYGGYAGDTLKGNAANNILRGMAGGDTLWGNGGRDTLSGEGDDDTIYAVDQEVDQISCGPGFDIVYYDGFHDTFPNNDCEDKRPSVAGTQDPSS